MALILLEDSKDKETGFSGNVGPKSYFLGGVLFIVHIFPPNWLILFQYLLFVFV